MSLIYFLFLSVMCCLFLFIFLPHSHFTSLSLSFQVYALNIHSFFTKHISFHYFSFLKVISPLRLTFSPYHSSPFPFHLSTSSAVSFARVNMASVFIPSLPFIHITFHPIVPSQTNASTQQCHKSRLNLRWRNVKSWFCIRSVLPHIQV